MIFMGVIKVGQEQWTQETHVSDLTLTLALDRAE